LPQSRPRGQLSPGAVTPVDNLFLSEGANKGCSICRTVGLESMSEDRVVDKIVTRFILDTCVLRPRHQMGLDVHRVSGAVRCVLCRNLEDDLNAALIPLVTGSLAEFYIEPMLPHVGDIDVMGYFNSTLAIPRGHPPPSVLPAEFHDNVEVFEIIDTKLSGFVYLKKRYLLTKCTDSRRYNAVQFKGRYRYLTIMYPDVLNVERHGPAMRNLNDGPGLLSSDHVRCVPCLSWPPQAADWPTRHRNYGWPDSAIVDRVVSNGCDLVRVAHRDCREDEWMNECQWRLSFSRAEIVLINSWVPIQQIVYHMLRVFMRTEKLTESDKNSEASTLSNYHIKTLMLWACELEGSSWWTDGLSLVSICVKLLHTFGVWLNEARCKSYFINCNLVETSSSLEMIANRLLLLDGDWLASWFVNNYIRQSAHVCPQHISQLFDDVSTSRKLKNAVSAVVNWRIVTIGIDAFIAFTRGQYDIAYILSIMCANEPSFVCRWVIELAKVDARLCIYGAGVALLNVACKLAKAVSIDNLMKALTVASNEFVHLSNCYNDRAFSLVKKVVALAHDYQTTTTNATEYSPLELSEMLQQTAVELLTIFRELEARDFNCIARTVTADFEALYAYKCGNYQRCLELSTENVRKLLYTHLPMPHVDTFPEFIQLLDDDIVSLTALTLIVNPECRHYRQYVCINQLPLSLYLMTQCQLKLRHSLTSLAQTLVYIRVAHRLYYNTLDQLTMKLIEKKLVSYITA